MIQSMALISEPDTRTGMPPGPPLPRAVQTAAFLFFPRTFFDACRKRYGDAVTFGTAFDSKFVMLFEPELVKQLFQGGNEQLRAGEANALLGPILGQRSVLLLDGAEHLRHRRLLLPPFHGRRMQAYEDTVRAAADRAIDSWPATGEFPLHPSMQALTLEVIMRAVFGMEAGPREDELRERIREMLDPIGRPFSILLMMLTAGRFGPNRGATERFEVERRRVDELLFAEIADRREQPDLEDRDDVFSALLLARDEDGEALTDQEVRDELVTLLVAGHETTATGLAWAFDLLLHTPHVLTRLREDLGDDEYLDAVVKETLRIRPVIPGVGRVVRGEPFALNGYTIPPGVEINPSITTIHRRADRYPQPAEFRPERFLGPDAPDTYTWIPFGGGTRRCLGASFALMEMRVVVRRVLERCELTPVGPLEKVQRRAITLVPKNGVPVRLARRS
ncbi:MAG TPA: cytochrome P450 [Solirubrobacteraceae bacterium]|nr:cytochrome P450 [Solirubrobacteraceae bacterium]